MSTDNLTRRNLTAQELLSLPIFQDYYVPHNESPLVKACKNFYDYLIEGKFQSIKKSEFKSNKNFDLNISTNIACIFGELIRWVKMHNLHTSWIYEKWGFDLNMLPDTPYLLRVVAFCFPESPLITNLPELNEVIDPLIQEFRRQKEQLLLQKLTEQKTTIKTGVSFTYPLHLAPYIAENKQTSNLYLYTKFRLADLQKNLATALDDSKTNPTLIMLLKESNCLNTIKLPALTESQAEQLKAITGRDDVKICSIANEQMNDLNVTPHKTNEIKEDNTSIPQSDNKTKKRSVSPRVDKKTENSNTKKAIAQIAFCDIVNDLIAFRDRILHQTAMQFDHEDPVVIAQMDKTKGWLLLCDNHVKLISDLICRIEQYPRDTALLGALRECTLKFNNFLAINIFN